MLLGGSKENKEKELKKKKKEDEKKRLQVLTENKLKIIKKAAKTNSTEIGMYS